MAAEPAQQAGQQRRRRRIVKEEFAVFHVSGQAQRTWSGISGWRVLQVLDIRSRQACFRLCSPVREVAKDQDKQDLCYALHIHIRLR